MRGTEILGIFTNASFLGLVEDCLGTGEGIMC